MVIHDDSAHRQPAPRILVVINRLTELGGAEGSTALLIAGLHGDAAHFDVVTLHGLELAGRADLEARGVRFVESGPGFRTQLRTVVRAIRAFRPDLVHSTLFDVDLVAGVAARWCRVPLVRSVVNTPYGEEARAQVRAPWRLSVLRRVDWALGRWATARFHAISETTRRSAVRWQGARPDRVAVVPRGRDAARLGTATPERRARVRAHLGIPPTAPVVLNVARQDAQKGHVLLVEAFGRVVEAMPDARLLIAGRAGPETPAVEARIAALGLGPCVRLLGVRDDVPDLLAAADVFAFPSLWEGLGGAVLEAMAVGTPVVAFAVPAVAEALGDTGVIVPIRDVAGLSDAIVELFRDPQRRADLVRRARQRFDARFTSAASLAGMDRLYRDVLTSHGSHRRERRAAR